MPYISASLGAVSCPHRQVARVQEQHRRYRRSTVHGPRRRLCPTSHQPTLASHSATRNFASSHSTSTPSFHFDCFPYTSSSTRIHQAIKALTPGLASPHLSPPRAVLHSSRSAPLAQLTPLAPLATLVSSRCHSQSANSPTAYPRPSTPPRQLHLHHTRPASLLGLRGTKMPSPTPTRPRRI